MLHDIVMARPIVLFVLCPSLSIYVSLYKPYISLFTTQFVLLLTYHIPASAAGISTVHLFMSNNISTFVFTKAL